MMQLQQVIADGGIGFRRRVAEQQFAEPNVSMGSTTILNGGLRHVRYYPNSGGQADIPALRIRASMRPPALQQKMTASCVLEAADWGVRARISANSRVTG